MSDLAWGRGPVLDWKKVLWFGGHGLGSVAALVWFDLSAALVCAGLALVTGCVGHSVGVHRLMIHRAFLAPLWVERGLVYLGTLMGMAGPLELVRMHHVRDVLQHRPECPDFFCHRGGMFRDFLWNFFYRWDLPPGVVPPVSSAAFADPFVRALDTTWRWQQLPLAVGLGAIGGWVWVFWGVSFRVMCSAIVHWYVGYRCHNDGETPHRRAGARVQGTNHTWLGILSFGEGFHNNHHAYPWSARMGLEAHQLDLGYLFIRAMAAAGLVWGVRTPEKQPADRAEAML